VEARVFDEMVDPEALMERALVRANEFVALPPSAFARSKRQLRSRACEAIEAAIVGAEPLLNGWLFPGNDPGRRRGSRPQGLGTIRRFGVLRT
jgi:enoyl-CoA hydratase/carnithine racemase